MKLFSRVTLVAFGAALVVAGCSKSVDGADLDRALDVTADTLTEIENQIGGAEVPEDRKDEGLEIFAHNLEVNLNLANPPVHPDPLGVDLQADGSMKVFHDGNGNQERDSGEKDLFTIEIDAEKGRLIATETNGYVRDHSFSGTSLLAGFVLGSLLSRQRGAGIGKGAFAGKSASAKRSNSFSARSRSGSGSHSSGK